MRLTHLSDGIHASSVSAAADIEAAAGLGIKSVIDVFPDAGAQRQIDNTIFAAAAEFAGLSYSRFAISSDELCGSRFVQFCRQLKNVKKSALIFSGDIAWPATLWALYEAQRTDIAYILKRLSGIGVDIDNVDLVGKLEKQKYQSVWRSIDFPVTF